MDQRPSCGPQLLEENVSSTLQDEGVGEDFLNYDPTCPGINPTIENLIKLKSFCATKKQPTEEKVHRMGESLLSVNMTKD